MNAPSLAALAAQVEHYRLVFRWPERSASLLLPLVFGRLARRSRVRVFPIPGRLPAHPSACHPPRRRSR